MALRFVTVAAIRLLTGLSTTIIDDNDLIAIGEDIEYQTEKTLNCNLTPTLEIEVQDGVAKRRIFTRRAPLLSLRALTINDTAVTLNTTTVDVKRSGMITLLASTDPGNFTRLKKTINLKYIHGRVAWDKVTKTTLSSDASAGASVALAVGDEAGFTNNDDWVEISSFNGNLEVSQITGSGADEITVDQLVFDHTSGATVRLLKIDPTILRYIKVWTSIAAVTRAVGQSFDDITGYTMGEFQVQKGEPFTQFRETIVRLEKQAEWLQSRVRPAPGILV